MTLQDRQTGPSEEVELEVRYQLAPGDVRRLGRKRWLSVLDPAGAALRSPEGRSRRARLLAIFPATWALYQLFLTLIDL